ncbi:unnamed protein product [Amoebophrya sp. A25]|nr:unnamed protein product [Amoebophrya sp. A25]|eukprot:GSA25T00021187001.1
MMGPQTLDPPAFQPGVATEQDAALFPSTSSSASCCSTFSTSLRRRRSSSDQKLKNDGNNISAACSSRPATSSTPASSASSASACGSPAPSSACSTASSTSACAFWKDIFCCKNRRCSVVHDKLSLKENGGQDMRINSIQKAHDNSKNTNINKRQRERTCLRHHEHDMTRTSTSSRCPSSTRSRTLCKRKVKFRSRYTCNKMNRRGQGRVGGSSSCCAVLADAGALRVRVDFVLAAGAAVVLVIMLVWGIDMNDPPPTKRTGGSRGFFVAATNASLQQVSCKDISTSAGDLFLREIMPRYQAAQAQNPGAAETQTLIGLGNTYWAAKQKAASATTPAGFLDFLSVVIPPYCGHHIPRYAGESQELDARTRAYIEAFNQKSPHEQQVYLLGTPKMVDLSMGTDAAVPKAAAQCCLPESGTTSTAQMNTPPGGAVAAPGGAVAAPGGAVPVAPGPGAPGPGSTSAYAGPPGSGGPGHGGAPGAVVAPAYASAGQNGPHPETPTTPGSAPGGGAGGSQFLADPRTAAGPSPRAQNLLTRTNPRSNRNANRSPRRRSKNSAATKRGGKESQRAKSKNLRGSGKSESDAAHERFEHDGCCPNCIDESEHTPEGEDVGEA